MFFKKITIERLNVLKDNDAQVMVEFMLIFPVFMMLIFGILEFSLLSLAHQNVNYASFNAARAEIVGMKPKKSAWMSLYMLSPHWVQGISPLEAFKMAYSNFKGGNISFDNRFDIYLDFVINSPCLLQIFGVESPLFEFSSGTSFELFGNTVRNLEDFLNAIFEFFAGGATELLNSAKKEYNDGIDDLGYNIPPFLRKALYAMSFVDIETKEMGDAEAPTVKVTVTYYYILKFPVIQSIVRYMHRNFGTGNEKIFAGTGAKWNRAKELSDKSGLVFIPLIHSCTMGNEKKFM